MRDKSRSRLPVIVVAIGVMLAVFLHAYINGFMGDTIEMNARFSYGHVKVMTTAYAIMLTSYLSIWLCWMWRNRYKH